jgi:hypothetical protein
MKLTTLSFILVFFIVASNCPRFINVQEGQEDNFKVARWMESLKKPYYEVHMEVAERAVSAPNTCYTLQCVPTGQKCEYVNGTTVYVYPQTKRFTTVVSKMDFEFGALIALIMCRCNANNAVCNYTLLTPATCVPYTANGGSCVADTCVSLLPLSFLLNCYSFPQPLVLLNLFDHK